MNQLTSENQIDLDTNYDPMSETMAQNPYVLYHDIQSRCPVGRASVLGGFWVASTYDTVNQAAGDYRTFTSAEGCSIPVSPVFPLYPIDIDPPLQTAYRKILNPRFTVEAIEHVREPFRKVVHQLIDGFVDKGEVLLAKELCQVAPLDIVLPLIGVPRDERFADLKYWVESIVRYRAVPERSVPAGENLYRYMMNLIADRRTAPPQDDVLGDLLGAKLKNEPLTDDDIYRTLTIVLFGGLDTTTAAMLEGARFLAETPAAWARLQADPKLWPSAIEEIVRYTSPAQAMARTVTKPVELGGVSMERGDKLMIVFGAANHDPTVYPEPEAIKIDRCPVKPHMGFGFGAHICLGRNLARLEVEELLKALFTRIPDLRVKPGTILEYHVSEARSMKELPCVFTPQKSSA